MLALARLIIWNVREVKRLAGLYRCRPGHVADWRAAGVNPYDVCQVASHLIRNPEAAPLETVEIIAAVLRKEASRA